MIENQNREDLKVPVPGFNKQNDNKFYILTCVQWIYNIKKLVLN
jgi:hypothetical protein